MPRKKEDKQLIIALEKDESDRALRLIHAMQTVSNFNFAVETKKDKVSIFSIDKLDSTQLIVIQSLAKFLVITDRTWPSKRSFYLEDSSGDKVEDLEAETEFEAYEEAVDFLADIYVCEAD